LISTTEATEDHRGRPSVLKQKGISTTGDASYAFASL
jgi:hypothetical protein